MSRRWLHRRPAATVLGVVLLCAAAAPGSSAAAITEWTFHKSADGAHPDGREQQYLWLMNRARQDPAAEGRFLASIDDPLIQSRLSGFQVNLHLLRAEFAALPPMPPAAFDARLHAAALAHSHDMIARDRQDHLGQSQRVLEAGFRTLQQRGNAYAFSESALEGHAAFNVDWGAGGPPGMQPDRPHRQAIMSIDAALTNAGIAVVRDLERRNQVGPFVVTGNYAQADEAFADHYNRFVVGTVWTDLDGNGRYDDGEGIEGVTVLPSRGPYYAVTAAGGGYAIPALAPGALSLRFEGAGVPSHTRSVSVGATSVLVDYALTEATASTTVPEPATAHGFVAGLALVALARRANRRPAPRSLDDADSGLGIATQARRRDPTTAMPIPNSATAPGSGIGAVRIPWSCRSKEAGPEIAKVIPSICVRSAVPTRSARFALCNANGSAAPVPVAAIAKSNDDVPAADTKLTVTSASRSARVENWKSWLAPPSVMSTAPKSE